MHADDNMVVKKYIFGGLYVACVSLIYNFFAFKYLGVQPDLSFDVELFASAGANFYLVVFLKNFLVGMILTVLFARGYSNILKDNEHYGHLLTGVFFMSLYGVFALLSFSVADIVLMRSNEGFLLLFTIDGFVETLIATVPIRLVMD